MTTLLETRSLSAGYGGVEIVRDLAVEIRPGEVVALLGANGAGKTTTLLTLAGVLKPLGGEVLYKGVKADRPAVQARPRRYRLRPRRTLGLPQAHHASERRGGRVDFAKATAVFPELEQLASRRAGLLSGGEQQMLTLGRALAMRPDLLLADELSLGLAPKTVGRLLRAVREAADGGIAALLVEQHVHRVLDIADRVYLLHHGRIQFHGTAAEARESIDEIQASYLTATD